MPTVIIDFDGTICDLKYPDVGAPKRGVREALLKIKKAGFKIVIHSVRTAKYWKEKDWKEGGGTSAAFQVEVIKNFMKEHNIPYHSICMDDKPIAMFYIDDNALRFQDNWEEITEIIMKSNDHIS